MDSTNVVSIWLGNGDGTFQPPVDSTGRGDSVVAADFNGDGRMDLAVINSAEDTVTVLLQLQPPTVTFTGAPSSAVYGSEFTVTAKTNASTDAIITASGACTVSLVSSSEANVAATILMTSATGTCNLAANWDADQIYAAASLSQSTLAAKAQQTISFGPILTQTVGTPLTLSATASSGLVVAFSSITTSVCTVSGTTAAFIAPGSCTIAANQAGNSTYMAAPMVPQTFTVNAALGFTLSASPTTVSVAQGGSGTTTITSTEIGGSSGAVSLSASGLPSGITASFAAGSTAGTQVLTLTASNSATVTSTPVTVTISGTSGTLSATTSIALTITAEPSFTAGSGGTTSITLNPGATTGNTGAISVVGTNGFAGTVTLSCAITSSPTGASDLPTCSLSPTSVTLGGTTAQTSTLTVNTTTSLSAENQMQKLFWPATGGTALALILLFCVPRRPRNWVAMLGLFVLFVSIGASGCGGGGSSGGGGGGGGNSGTTAGSYTITVTGTGTSSGSSSSIAATVSTVTLTVN